MKRILFTTAILLSFLSSCQKETSSVQKEAEPIVFTACIAESADTKVSVDCTAGKVSWVEGDSILISNGPVTKTYIADKSGATTTFTVKESSKPAFSEAAQYSATYGTIPTPGAAQQYSDTPGALVYMEAPETENTSTPTFTFEVKCGLLKLNLKATDKSVKRIYVSDGTNTYSLVCETAQSIGTATDFYIALPAGSYTKYVIRDSEGYEAVKTAKTTGTGIESNKISKVTFSTLDFTVPKYTEGVYTGVGIKIGSIWWAPVNCGYEPATTTPAYKGYPYGKLYQWGRKYGQGYYKDATKTSPKYEDATYPSGTNLATGPIPNIPTSSDAEKFYKVTATPYNWYNGTSPAPDALWGASKTIYDPCPDGWRVPTVSELTALMGSHTGGALQDGIGIYSGMKGKYFDGSSTVVPTSGLFLPAAGGCSYNNGDSSERGSSGYYWSSTVNGNKARNLHFYSDNGGMYSYNRAYGYSVRCVQE